ncbi:MAG: PSD1 domain-containing protein [Pirellulales bacterium]|nr:PSD1 domain-containing protein [Pirellulales bacterium]
MPCFGFYRAVGCCAMLVLTVASRLSAADEHPAAKSNAAPMLPSPDGLKLFNDEVHAILVTKCVDCHGGKKVESDFDMTTREGLLKGGAYGEAIVPGKASDSLLVKVVRHTDDPHMPEGADKLPDDMIAKIEAWIDAGAPYSGPLVKKGAPKGHSTVTAADRDFWSFRPLDDPQPPAVKDSTWARTAIDRFILAKLESQGIQPNLAADKRVLIRRAYFDLLGLPPTLEEVESFANDASPDAYEKWIDRLLESPHYGERWGRHWLDLVRFAESHGYEHDTDRPNAYPYRDFVIKALNADMPYNQFVRWQIAGDEFAPEDPLAWIATGFLGAGTHATQITANQAEKERYDELDDQVSTIGTALLGLTIGCARCHDHKFDPIPTHDYYRMIATFTKTVRSDHPVVLNAAEYCRQKGEFEAKLQAKHAELRQYASAALQPWLAQRSDDADRCCCDSWIRVLAPGLEIARQLGLLVWFESTDAKCQAMAAEINALIKEQPKPETQTALVCSEGLPPIRLNTQGPDYYEQTYFLKRGDLSQKIGAAAPGFLQVLMRLPNSEQPWSEPAPEESRTPYRRRNLAHWITDVHGGAGNLLARVIVNRLWQHHFGRGLVATPSDFGTQGEPPTQPELLDWLAQELIRNNWRLKPLHRSIMTSAVYRQSATFDATRSKIDPDNLLHWRRTRHRLEGEIIRDAMLVAGGTLDEKMFGPGTLDQNQKRRSIYFTVKRSQMIPLLTLFDAPDALQGVGQRPSTTVAPQALWLLNNPQVQGYARAFAERLRSAADDSIANAVRRGYEIAFSRLPTDSEQSVAIEYLAEQTKELIAAGKQEDEALLASLTNFCQALFSLNEFIYVE